MFALVSAKCLGGSLFSGHTVYKHATVACTISEIQLRLVVWKTLTLIHPTLLDASVGGAAVGMLSKFWYSRNYTVVQKNVPTLADYNYDPVQSILIIFSKLFPNDHKSCLVVKFSTSPHICCHYTLWNTMLYFALFLNHSVEGLQ